MGLNLGSADTPGSFPVNAEKQDSCFTGSESFVPGSVLICAMHEAHSSVFTGQSVPTPGSQAWRLPCSCSWHGTRSLQFQVGLFSKQSHTCDPLCKWLSVPTGLSVMPRRAPRTPLPSLPPSTTTCSSPGFGAQMVLRRENSF